MFLVSIFKYIQLYYRVLNQGNGDKDGGVFWKHAARCCLICDWSKVVVSTSPPLAMTSARANAKSPQSTLPVCCWTDKDLTTPCGQILRHSRDASRWTLPVRRLSATAIWPPRSVSVRLVTTQWFSPTCSICGPGRL